jgi:hypothetical protein
MPINCPNSARNTVRYESERCPAEIGTLSDRNWNQRPTAPGIRTNSAKLWRMLLLQEKATKKPSQTFFPLPLNPNE